MKIYNFFNIPTKNALYDDNIVVSRDDNALYETIHAHDYYEIEYICAGNGVQVINGVTYLVKKGDVIFLKKNDEHTYYSVGEMSVLNLCMKNDFIRGIDAEIETVKDSLFELSNPCIQEFEMLIDMLERELREKRKFYTQNIRHIVSMIIITLKRNGCFQSPFERKWVECLEFITKKYADITLDEAANSMYLSKNYFCRIFKKKIGMTFGEYLNNVRIQKAKELLLTTEDSVGVICAKVGFTQSKQFYQLFKKRVGMTPLKYRKNHAD